MDLNDDSGFSQRYETENFIIKIERAHHGEKDTDLKAKIYLSYKDNDKSAYYSEAKFTSRSLNTFAKEACRAQAIDPETYKDEIVDKLLQEKTNLHQIAKERKNYLKEQHNKEEGSEDSIINRVIKKVYKEKNLKIEDFAEIRNFNDLIEANNDLLIIESGNELILTNKGVEKAEEMLDISTIENVDEEAEKVLEEGFLKYFLEAISEVHKGDEELKVWELVSALSAKCSERQINSWAVGPSGKGKSHIKRAIVKFLPDEAYEAPNSMSPKAMLYKTREHGPDIFKGKLLFLDEAEGYDNQDALVLLRGLTDPDEDRFVHEMVKDQDHEELVIEKPLTVWFTSVESMADEQLKNRFILTNPDGSSELDDIVFEHQMQNLHAGNRLGRPPAETEVVKKCIEKIRQDTAGLTPIVPFQVEWKQKFNRRLYPYFVTLMEIIAKMNYKNRVIKENYIYVTRADFRTASLVWSALIDTTIAQTDTEALKLIMELPEEKRESMRTSELARRLDGFNTDKVRRKAEALRETEELQLINAEKEGGQWEYWAGNDKNLLVNPEPEIVADPDTVEEMLEKTEKGSSEDIIKSMTDSEVAVYDQLEERKQNIEEEKMSEVNDWTIELESDEKKLLKFMEDMDLENSVKIQDIAMMYGDGDTDKVWTKIEELEDRGLLKIYEDENGLERAKKTHSYKQMREEGKITL